MNISELADAILAGSSQVPRLLDEAETVLVLGEIRDRCRKAPSSAGETGKLKDDLAAVTARAEKAESELGALRIENAKLKAKDADFENRVHLKAAQELCRIGIREHVPTSSTETPGKMTATQVCLAAKAAGTATAPVPASPIASAEQGDDGDEE